MICVQVGFRGTQSADYGMSPTDCGFYVNELGCFQNNIEEYSYLELLIMENAIKALKRVVYLGRIFCAIVKAILVPLKIIITLRLCFSKSGYLPTRIRKIFKQKEI